MSPEVTAAIIAASVSFLTLIGTRQVRAARYDKDLATARIRLLSAQATSGFMRHVLAGPATST